MCKMKVIVMMYDMQSLIYGTHIMAVVCWFSHEKKNLPSIAEPLHIE